MGTTRLATTARNAACRAVLDLLDAGAGGGKLHVYTGSIPTSPQDDATGTLLATLTFASPLAFGSPSVGTAIASSIEPDLDIRADGTPGWCRLTDGNDTVVMDCDAGGPLSSAVIKFDTDEFETGGTVRIAALTYTTPETYTDP